MVKPVTIFISYSHKDASFLQELLTFLKPYEKNKTISVWTDKDIVAGQQWNELIKANLNRSEVILFLVSPDFLASDYINDTEIMNALENNKLIIIPIIVRPIVMNLLQIKSFQVIPTGAKAVVEWDSRDQAWNDVITALKTVIDKINAANAGQLEDVTHSNNGTNHSFNLRRGNLTDTLLKWFFVLLIAICIVVFVYGFVQRDTFYSFTSIAGMGASFTAYFFVRRF